MAHADALAGADAATDADVRAVRAGTAGRGDLLAPGRTEPHADTQPAPDSHAVAGLFVRLGRLQRLLSAFLDKHADPRAGRVDGWGRRRVDR